MKRVRTELYNDEINMYFTLDDDSVIMLSMLSDRFTGKVSVAYSRLCDTGGDLSEEDEWHELDHPNQLREIFPEIAGYLDDVTLMEFLFWEAHK